MEERVKVIRTNSEAKYKRVDSFKDHTVCFVCTYMLHNAGLSDGQISHEVNKSGKVITLRGLTKFVVTIIIVVQYLAIARYGYTVAMDTHKNFVN